MARPGRPHRLPLQDYVGTKTVCFETVTFDRARIFTTPEVVEPQVAYLARAAKEFGCVVPIYCFMPDHLHVMFMGLEAGSNGLSAMSKFKLLSGLWLLRKGLPGWQPSFYDHIMRAGEDWRRHASYIAMNPVRAGLVENCFDFPFLGTIGCDLQDVVLPMA